MKTKSAFFILTMIILISTGFPALAEPKTTLKQAIITAFENNNDLKSNQYGVLATKRNISIQRSNLLPKLRFNETFGSTNQGAQALAYRLDEGRLFPASLTIPFLNNPPPINAWLTEIALEQTLFNRKDKISIGIARNEYTSQNYNYLRRQEDIANQVALSYIRVNRDRKLVAAAQQNLAETQANLNLAQYKYEKKAEFISAVYRAQTALYDAQQSLVSAQKALQISQRALGLAMGTEESVDITENDFPTLTLTDLSYYKNLSLERNDVKAMEVTYKNAKENIKFAKSDYFPTLGISGAYQFWDHRSPFLGEGLNYIAGGSLKWDAFDGLKRNNNTAKAQDLAQQAYQNLEGLKKRVSFQVFQSYTTVQESSETLQLAEAALKSVKTGRDRVYAKYENSQIHLVDLLETQTNLNATRVACINRENQYENALIDLSFQSGSLLKDLGFE